MAQAQVELFIVKLDYTSGVVGGGSMLMQLGVDPVRGTLNGRADGSIQEGTQHAPTFVASATGHVHSTGLGNVTKVGAVSGEAVVSFPPPAIGSYRAPFSASFAVDNQWVGTGKFSVGNDTYECRVNKPR